jgi:rubrerythrin
MADSPELIKLTLKIIDQQVMVQGVNFSDPHISELSFDFSIDLDSFPCLDRSSAQSHLKALIYEIPDSSEAFPQLEKLTKSNDKALIAVFSDQSTKFSSLYLLARNDDKQGLGSCFTGAKFGLFSFHHSDLLGYDSRNYIQYMKMLKASKSRFVKKLQEKHSDIDQMKEEKKYFEDIADYLRARSFRLKEEVETAKQAISQLKFQISKKESQLKQRQSLNTICIICKSSLKEVVFIPCGHILLCKSCMIETMQVSPGTSIAKSGKSIKCPSCSTSLKKSKLVFI